MVEQFQRFSSLLLPISKFENRRQRNVETDFCPARLRDRPNNNIVNGNVNKENIDTKIKQQAGTYFSPNIFCLSLLAFHIIKKQCY